MHVFSTVDSHLKCVSPPLIHISSMHFPSLIHISSMHVFSTVDSHLKCVSPPSIHISSMHFPSLIHILKHVFSTIASHLKHACVCVLHHWFTSQACMCVCSPPLIHISSMHVFSTVDSHLKCMSKLIIQGLGYQIMLRNMALVQWGNTTGAIL